MAYTFLSSISFDTKCNKPEILDYRIIVSTETETFANKSQLVKLFRELKFMPLRCHKKVHWFFSNVCNPNFATVWWFTVRQHVNGCIFANKDVFFILFIRTYNRLVIACIVMTAIGVNCLCFVSGKKRHCLWVYSLLIAFFCLCDPQQIWQFSV